MAVNLSLFAGAGAQFFNSSGVILSGGLVYTYAAGTTTPQTTYTTSAGNVAHANPIVLDSAGRVPSGGEIWLTDAIAYKFVLQTSAAVLIATYDNVTGNASGIISSLAASSGSSLIGYTQGGVSAVATTVQAKLRQYVSAKDFGVVGNGSTDDTNAMQAFLNAAQGKTGLLNSGTYLINDTLIIKSGTILVGEGFSNSILVAGASLGNKAILLNQNYTGTLNVYTDVNISISNIGFNGSNITVTSSELVSLGKINGLSIDNCKFYNRPYIGLALGGCLNFNVTNSEFTGCGKAAVTTEGGSALWIGTATDTTISTSGTATNNYIHNNEWSGIYASGNRLIISQNNIITNKEAGIFQTGNNNIINDNKIVAVTKKYISASGIETGGFYHVISNNYISDVDASCIALTDVQNTLIEGNLLGQAARDIVTYPQGAGISVITTQVSPNQPNGIFIGNNKYFCSDSATFAAVDIGNTGDAPIYLTITTNDFSGVTYSSGKTINVQAGKSNATQVFRDNIGAFDIFDYGGYVQARYYAGEALSPSASGTLTITANTMYATPFAIRQQQVWTKIGVNVTTAQATASAYLGIYRMENGIPTSLVGTPGTVSLATTGLKELTISEMLQQGMYAVFILPSISAVVITAGTLSNDAIATVGTTTFGGAETLITGSYTYGTPPATFPTVVYATGSSPLITLRYGV